MDLSDDDELLDENSTQQTLRLVPSLISNSKKKSINSNIFENSPEERPVKKQMIPQSKNNYQVQILFLQKENEKLQMDLDQINAETNVLVSQLNEIKSKNISLKQKIESLPYGDNIMKLREFYHQLKVKNLQAQQFSQTKIDQMESKIDDLQEKIKNINPIVEKAQKKNQDLISETDSLQNQLHDMRMKNIKLSIKAKKAEKNLTDEELQKGIRDHLQKQREKCSLDILELKKKKKMTKREYQERLKIQQDLQEAFVQAEREVKEIEIQFQH